jgi:hypothetical protein
MRKKRNTRDQTLSRFFAGLQFIEYISLGLALLTSSHLKAETVYRCGDDYSTSAKCADGRSAEIKTHAEVRTSAHDSTSSATRDLHDAEALEKNRLRSEKQTAQSVPPRMMDTRQNLTSSNTDDNATNLHPKGLRHRRPQSPYFTAKDPNTPPKKKGNAKALPPAAN